MVYRDRPHVLLHGRGGPEGAGDQGEDGAHGEEGGRLGVAGIGIIVFLLSSFPALARKSAFAFHIIESHRSGRGRT